MTIRHHSAVGGTDSATAAAFPNQRDITVGLVRGDDVVVAALHTYEVLGADSMVRVYPRLDDGVAAFDADRGAGP